MSRVFEMNPVSAITTDAVGEPGSRVFYLQARTSEDTITLLVEKAQVQVLANAIYQLLAEVDDDRGTGPRPSLVDPLDLDLRFPMEPVFRVDNMELEYDAGADLVILVAHELVPRDAEGEPQEESDTPASARFHATRAQMHALAYHALEVAARGRPVCPHCGQPEGPQGHVCPKRNGHARGLVSL